jgi:hypothetical protein
VYNYFFPGLAAGPTYRPLVTGLTAGAPLRGTPPHPSRFAGFAFVDSKQMPVIFKSAILCCSGHSPVTLVSILLLGFCACSDQRNILLQEIPLGHHCLRGFTFFVVYYVMLAVLDTLLLWSALCLCASSPGKIPSMLGPITLLLLVPARAAGVTWHQHRCFAFRRRLLVRAAKHLTN